MAMQPYESFRGLDQFRRDIDRIFGTDLPFFRGERVSRQPHLHVDVYEHAGEIIAECDIPGLGGKEDVQIDIDQQTLTISGQLKSRTDLKDEQWHHQERFAGRFQRTVHLPSTVSSEGVKAMYRNGVLEVRMPKTAAESRKRIDVQFH